MADQQREGFEDWLRDCGVIRPDGTMDIEQAKKELSDYHFMLEQVSRVYIEVSGGKLSKPNYYAHSVIEAYTENIEQQRKDAMAILGEDLVALEDVDAAEFKEEALKMARECIKEAETT